MSAEKRVINREYINSKSLIYIGEEKKHEDLIGIFQRAFKNFQKATHIEDFTNDIQKYDIVVCYENDHSLSHLKTLRELDKTKKPFILIANESCDLNPSIYIQDSLSQYLKLSSNYTEVMYIIQHELQNYDKRLENIYLQEEHEAYLEMLENTVIVSRTDLQGNITYANDIFCEISKYSKEELIGSQHKILRHPEMSSSVFKELWQSIKADRIWKGTIKNIDKDGQTYITNSTIAPYYSKGEKVGYIGIRYLVTDAMTEKRNLKSHLTKTIIDHKNALKEKDQEIKSLERKNAMADAYEEAWQAEIVKKEKLEKQIKTFESELRAAAQLHDKRVADYLKERREYAETLQKKERKIDLLQEELESVKQQNKDYESAMIERGTQLKAMHKRIKELEDVLEHREEQLANLR